LQTLAGSFLVLVQLGGLWLLFVDSVLGPKLSPGYHIHHDAGSRFPVLPLFAPALSCPLSVRPCRCDLVSLGSVSAVEDRIEAVTGGTKAVRCRYSRIPLELVLNIDVQQDASETAQAANNSSGYLSHERAGPPVKMRVAKPGGSEEPSTKLSKALTRSVDSRGGGGRDGHSVEAQLWERRAQGAPLHQGGPHSDGGVAESLAFAETRPAESSGRGEEGAASRHPDHGVSDFSSASVHLEAPLSLAHFQEWVGCQLKRARGLLRAKGIAWFAEDRWGPALC
jgi:G3E family GTPase